MAMLRLKQTSESTKYVSTIRNVMRRSILDDLMEWKGRPDHKPAMIEGVRRCGKTWSVKELGRTYPDCAYFDFEDDRSISCIFDRDLTVDRIVKELGIHRSKAIPEDCLIVLDGIQLCPRAMTSLKYFCEDGRYDVVCAGSLPRASPMSASPPVGKVEDFVMHPMSFEEFLHASGEGMLADLVSDDPFDSSVESFHDRLIGCYREYLAVGGLPEAVLSWTTNHDPERVESILRSLARRYSDDIARYGSGNIRTNGEAVWRSVPMQLARTNNRFVFGHVRKGVRARDIRPSVDWLERAGLVYAVPIAVDTEPPSPAASAFKLYCFDCGIMRVLADIPLGKALSSPDGYGLYKGAITENYVMTELRRMTPHRIFCWRSGNKAEVDFLTTFDSNPVPIEVKAGERVRTQSLKVYLDSHIGTGVIASLRPMSRTERVLGIPLYELWMLPRALDERGARVAPGGCFSGARTPWRRRRRPSSLSWRSLSSRAGPSRPSPRRRPSRSGPYEHLRRE